MSFPCRSHNRGGPARLSLSQWSPDQPLINPLGGITISSEYYKTLKIKHLQHGKLFYFLKHQHSCNIIERSSSYIIIHATPRDTT